MANLGFVAADLEGGDWMENVAEWFDEARMFLPLSEIPKNSTARDPLLWHGA